MLRHHPVALRSVEVVCIDHGERLLDGVGGHQDRLRRAPRLGAPGRHAESRGNLVQFLKDVVHRNALFKTRAHYLLERLLDILADDKNQLPKPGAHGVKDRVVDDGFAARANRLNLLQTTVTAAHTGSQNKKCGGYCCAHEPESSLTNVSIEW